MKRSEAEIGVAVVTELQRQGYDTYEEVSCGYAGQRADVVAVRGALVAIVECKSSLSLRLLDQLTLWRGRAHRIIGAIHRGKVGAAVERFCAIEGIGLWTVGYGELYERIPPKLHRVAGTREIRRYLNDAQRTGTYASAGSVAGNYWTPFRATCRELDRVVKGQPGIELRAALRAIQHHYSNERSAASAIPELIKKGVIVSIRAEGKPLRLYPADTPAPSTALPLEVA